MPEEAPAKPSLQAPCISGWKRLGLAVLGAVVTGIAGYHAAWDWAVRATTEDTEWDGGIAVIVVYGIIGIATLVAAIAGAILTLLVTWLTSRRAPQRQA